MPRSTAPSHTKFTDFAAGLLLVCGPNAAGHEERQGSPLPSKVNYEFSTEWSATPCMPGQWIDGIGLLSAGASHPSREFFVVLNNPRRLAIGNIDTGAIVRSIPCEMNLAGPCLMQGGLDFDGNGIGDIAIVACEVNQEHLAIVSGVDGKVLLNRKIVDAGRPIAYSLGWEETASAPARVFVGRVSSSRSKAEKGMPISDGGGVIQISTDIVDSAAVARGDSATDGFGWAMCNIGDVDGDSIDEYAVGAPFSLLSSHSSGCVRVVSGKTLGTINALWPETTDNQLYGHGFGRNVAPCDDIDQDGVGDMIVCAPGDRIAPASLGLEQTDGIVRVYSGKKSTLLSEFRSQQDYMSSPYFGSSAVCIGDIDGDSRPEIVISAPEEKRSGIQLGALYCYSTGTGQLLCRLVGEAELYLGESMKAAVVPGRTSRVVLAKAGRRVVCVAVRKQPH